MLHKQNLYNVISNVLYTVMWARQLSRYSDWLRAGRSRFRIPVRARFSALVQTGSGVHPASCKIGTRFFPGVKSGLGLTLTPHTLLVPLVMKGQSYTSAPPMGNNACTEPQCLYKGALYFFNYTLLQEFSIRLLPIELNKINYRHLLILKFKRILNFNFNFKLLRILILN